MYVQPRSPGSIPRKDVIFGVEPGNGALILLEVPKQQTCTYEVFVQCYIVTTLQSLLVAVTAFTHAFIYAYRIGICIKYHVCSCVKYTTLIEKHCLDIKTTYVCCISLSLLFHVYSFCRSSPSRPQLSEIDDLDELDVDHPFTTPDGSESLLHYTNIFCNCTVTLYHHVCMHHSVLTNCL